MNANELRVGNYIQSGRIWYLESSEDGTYFYKADSFGSNAIPTLLTEEWLLKFGFGKKEWGREYVYHTWTIKYSDYGLFTVEQMHKTDPVFESEFCSKILFVHQLQNLYFALIGEELILKEQE